MEPGQSRQEWARRQARGGESINQLVTKSLLSPPEDLVPCRAAQWGSRERRQEPPFCSGSAQDFEFELLVSGDHQAQHRLAHGHTEVEVTRWKEKPALVCRVHRKDETVSPKEGLEAAFAKLWT